MDKVIQNKIQYFEKNEMKKFKYINQLQKFFDIVDNVENEDLKMDIIYQMLRCNEFLLNEIENKYKNNIDGKTTIK